EPRLSTAHAWAGGMGHPHIGIKPRDLEISREDADDVGRKGIKYQRRAEGIARTSESRLPEAMTNHHQSLLLLGFFGRKAASENGVDTEEWKQVGGDTRANDLLRVVCAGQHHRHGIERGHVREALTLTLPLFDVPKG